MKISKRTLQIIICIVAGFMIGYGIYREEVSIVLQKAIRVCLECIGLG